MTNAHRGAVAKDLPGLPSARSAFAMLSPDEPNSNAGEASHLVLSGRGARVLKELAGLMEQARRGTTALEDKSDLKRESQRSEAAHIQSGEAKSMPSERRHRTAP
jgi:hypothetical protein